MRRDVSRLLILASPWFVVGAARGQETDETQPAWGLRPGLVHLNVADAWLSFESSFEDNRVRYPGSIKQRSVYENKSTELRELFGLKLAGDVIDPNLVDWRAMFELGPTQSCYRQDYGFRGDDSDDGFLHEYDVSVDVLKSKPLSFHAYARRTDDRLPRPFLPTLHQEITEAGASAILTTGRTTTELGYTFRDVDLTGNRVRADNESGTLSRFYLDNKVEFSGNHRFHLTYQHEREQSEYQGGVYDYTTRRDDLRLEHELAFGPEKQHRLDTFFQYDAEEGDLARDDLQLCPRLTLRHTDRLQTIYRYSFYRIEQDAIEVEQHKFDVEAVYRPSDQWRYTLDAFGLYEHMEYDTETYEYGAGPDISYTRPTPWGTLSANLAFAFDQVQVVGDAGRRFVRGEAHALSTIKPVFLRERDVIPATILARDARRTRIFIPGVDYTVTMIGRRALLRRVPWGRIAEGDVVYFDYQYTVPTRATINSCQTSFMLDHEFTSGLTPYYYLEARCEEVQAAPGSPAYRDNMNHHRFGVRYGRERWSVTNEVELYDDTIQPYDAWHLTGQYSVARSSIHSLDLTGQLSRYWFDDDRYDPDVWWGQVTAKDRWSINEYLSLDAGTAYHFEDNSTEGQTHGLDIECGLRYVRGLLTVELVAEYDLLSVIDSREDDFQLWLNIRREIPDLFASLGKMR